MINSYNGLDDYFSVFPNGTAYLAFRDLLDICGEAKIGARALDFGCGAGRSSILLKENGYITTGVDISEDLIERAKLNYPSIQFLLLDKELPITNQIDEKYDLILLSLVLTDYDSLALISDCLTQLSRLLKDQGKIVIITPAEELYRKSWYSTDNSDCVNKVLNSGDVVVLRSKLDHRINIKDHYWTDINYRKAFADAGLSLKDLYKPLGLKSDPIAWLDEYQHAPFSIYTLQHDNT